MRALPSLLRKQLETSVLAARRAAEVASRAAIGSLGVFADRRPDHLDSAQASLRNGLRAKWRQLGNDRDLLVAEGAYEQWHRLLFARFLAENGLLLHPQFRVPVTLAECEELAADLGEPDAWSVAARFAAEILPGIFRLDDPCVRLRLAPEGRHALEQILDAIPAETFAADDALGWVYQFWQKDKKDEVNASERKIGGADLGPVTQLFTENYMVRFLLENSLGAWWAARHPDSQLVKGFEHLRFDDDGRPAAGTFEGWPDRVAEVTVMDPCCGSGHFLVEAFSMLWQMRAEEEGLAPVEAQDAVLRDNLFGLELDPRCVQIAMFNVALQAWKAGGSWRQLPVPNIACSGLPVRAPIDEWKSLIEDDDRIASALLRFHVLFREADTLGSLIDPRSTVEIADGASSQHSFDDVEWNEVEPLISEALSAEAADPATEVLGADALGIARAAQYLSRPYTLITTNVPYLARRHQSDVLKDYTKRLFRNSSANLATAIIARFASGPAPARTLAVVSPQNWLYAATYAEFRRDLLNSSRWSMLARLGPSAFRQISGEVVDVHLAVVSPCAVGSGAARGIDVQTADSADDKEAALKTASLISWSPLASLRRADAVIRLDRDVEDVLLSDFADAKQGLATGDDPRHKLCFWEFPVIPPGWERHQSSVDRSQYYGGCELIVNYSYLVDHPDGTALRGTDVWGKRGISIRQTRPFYCSIYLGVAFDMNAAAVVPRNDDDLSAIWHFCTSEQYRAALVSLDPSLKVTNATLVKVPFDKDRWRKVSQETDPIPQPWSDVPTQWLFEGRPDVSTAPLQVAAARLVGYRWPEQPESDDLDALADADGIVCLPAVAGEPPAADRVQQLLAAAFGESWTPAKVKELLEQAGSKKNNLADWLRDEFFKQHCSLFGNRPFVWHIWDGQRDGFSALVNYHRLDRKTLEKLTYTYLGQDWVERQRAEVRDGVAGAEARLAAALGLQKRLEAILGGDAPLDVYVRWREIYEQPIGWEPDLNDGVRLNIRPFVEAGVLRSPFNIHWRKDRGKNPDGTERLNDVHLTLAEKIEARKEVGRA